MDLLALVIYIKNKINLLIKFKVDNTLSKENKSKNKKDTKFEEISEDWESLLRKEEACIRKHISTEHQLKLYIEQMKERIDELELENKSLLTQVKKTKILEKEIDEYKNRINFLNKLIKEYEEREIKLLEKENKINSKEEEAAAAPSLKDEGIMHSCSSTTKISYSSKKVPSLQKDIKYISPIVHQKLKSRKILRKSHIMNSNSSINSKKNDSFTRNNEDARSTIDLEKYNNSTIFAKKNYSLYSYTIKNNFQNNKIKYVTNKNSEVSMALNNSQLFENKNIKLYEKLDIYKRILNKKLSNISKKKKNNSYKSDRNNSVFISSGRQKNNCHSHSLENEFYSVYSNKTNNITNKLKGITIKVIRQRSRNKNKTSDKNSIYSIKQNILNKNQLFNANPKNTKILVNKINGNILTKGDNDNSLRNFFFSKIDNNKTKNKIFVNFRQTSHKKKS